MLRQKWQSGSLVNWSLFYCTGPKCCKIYIWLGLHHFLMINQNVRRKQIYIKCPPLLSLSLQSFSQNAKFEGDLLMIKWSRSRAPPRLFCYSTGQVEWPNSAALQRSGWIGLIPSLAFIQWLRRDQWMRSTRGCDGHRSNCADEVASEYLCYITKTKLAQTLQIR